MLFRFSLYGFLKNQRYFEPFLILAFAEKGLSFFAIGGLIACREVATTLLEIPSGSIADLLGRRRSMAFAFAGYVCSFVLFWLASQPWLLVPAMLLFSVGEAFRTGTHKAMIFEWLRQQGRTDEKTRIYGYTRSWSKLGSASSALVGAALVFWLEDLTAVFWLSAIPAGLNFVNLWTYPKDLEGAESARKSTVKDVLRHSVAAVKAAFQRPRLRRVLGESMAFEGLFHSSKDYLQPLLAGVALALYEPALVGTAADLDQTASAPHAIALWVGPVYFLLHLLSALASRRAHRLVAAVNDDEAAAARLLWSASIAIFVAMLGGLAGDLSALAIGAFVLLHVAQNLWRPILISRIDGAEGNGTSAVGLSVESQARRLATMVMAPLLGLAVDHAGALWPVPAFGAALAIAMRVR